MKMPSSDTPIFDALDGFAPPHQQMAFFGHERAEQTLLDAWQSGKMHHAWLFTGPKGIGKATLAYRAARFIFNEGNMSSGALIAADTLSIPEDSHSARLVANQGHPNLLTIERPFDPKTKRFKTEITVDEVRKTVRFFGSTAGENTWRVCIVDPADDLNGNAANALLKILEEPPVRTVFFLISHAPGRLLPTIRSRCRRLTMEPLRKAPLKAAIRALEIAEEAETIERLAQICGGSPRHAAELTSNDGLILVHAFERLLTKPFKPDYESLNAFGDLVAQRGKDQYFTNFIDLTHRYLSQLLEEKRSGGQAKPADLYDLAETWETVGASLRETQIFNLDKKQTAIEVMRALARTSR